MRKTLKASSIFLLPAASSFSRYYRKSLCLSINFLIGFDVDFLGSVCFHHAGACVLLRMMRLVSLQDEHWPIDRYTSVQFSRYCYAIMASPAAKSNLLPYKYEYSSCTAKHSLASPSFKTIFPASSTLVAFHAKEEENAFQTTNQQLFFSFSHSLAADCRRVLSLMLLEVMTVTFSAVMVCFIWEINADVADGTVQSMYYNSDCSSVRLNYIRRQDLPDRHDETNDVRSCFRN